MKDDALIEALKNCENEPIHLISKIQSYGVLLSFSSDFEVLQFSRNVYDFFALNAVDLLGKPLSHIVGEQNSNLIMQRLQDQVNDQSNALTVMTICMAESQIHDKNKLILQAHRSEGIWIFEFIRITDCVDEAFYHEVMKSISFGLMDLESAGCFDSYVVRVVEKIRDITGYDRVMMYQFDNHWNGEVIAESHKMGLKSYLGQHFPAADIPAQARRLYTRSHFRLLADTEAEPSDIFPVINPVTQKPLDLSLCLLRGISPVHIQYLRNIDTRATMSISLLQNGRLWGLIACHHITPKPINYRIRMATDLISSSISQKLSELENIERSKFQRSASECTLKLMRNAVEYQLSSNDFFQFSIPALLDLMKANGMIIGINHQLFYQGDIMPPQGIDIVLKLLKSKPDAEVFYSDCLMSEDERLTPYKDIASGLLVTPMNNELSDFVLWFRPEEVSEIRWGGEFKKPELNYDNQYILTPRKSINDWIEKRHGYCKAWSVTEVGEAYNLGLSVLVAFSRIREQTRH